MRTMIRLWLGKLFVALGIPGFIVSQTYDAQVTTARVRVYLGPLFSVVSVNGLDIYFHRLTGKIDGVGLTAPSACATDQTP
jgi:hypothetical protein